MLRIMLSWCEDTKYIRFVIIKCRIPSLRRRAIALLSAGARKESVFHARSMGEIAVRMIEFEEAGLELPVPSVDTPSPPLDGDDDDRLPSEEQRIQNLEILVNKVAGRFEIRVTRYLRGSAGTCIKDSTDIAL